MRISALISEMKNLPPPAQPKLNHSGHDAHISVIISSVFGNAPSHCTIVYFCGDWRRQWFRLQPLSMQREEFAAYA
jgi:hypothetical protein